MKTEKKLLQFNVKLQLPSRNKKFNNKLKIKTELWVLR